MGDRYDLIGKCETTIGAPYEFDLLSGFSIGIAFKLQPSELPLTRDEGENRKQLKKDVIKNVKNAILLPFLVNLFGC